MHSALGNGCELNQQVIITQDRQQHRHRFLFLSRHEPVAVGNGQPRVAWLRGFPINPLQKKALASRVAWDSRWLLLCLVWLFIVELEYGGMVILLLSSTIKII